MPGTRSKHGGLRLENRFVRIDVESRGGAIAAIAYKPAIRFPLIADRGAGVAAFGRLWKIRIEIEDEAAELGPVTLEKEGNRSLCFSGAWEGGIAWERRLELDAAESGFRLRDSFVNRSGRLQRFRLVIESAQAGADWRLADRTWIGDDSACLLVPTSSLPVPGRPPFPAEARTATPGRFFWRQVGMYGTGILYRARPPGKGELAASVLPGDDRAVEIGWRSEVFRVPAGRLLVLDGDVLVDEGGGAPDQGNAFHPVFVRSDFAAGAGRGGPLLGIAAAVSARRRRVRLKGPGGASAEILLTPGKVARLPIALHPTAQGLVRLRVTAAEGGKTMGAASAEAIVGGQLSEVERVAFNGRMSKATRSTSTWKAFDVRPPEEHYAGSWEEIGEAMIRNPRRIGGPTSMECTVGEIAAPDNDLDFYRRHLPFYAALVAGAARAAGTDPRRVGLVKRGQRDKPAACMDVACYGPDGPINAFSKERDGPDYQGLGYVRVIPHQGHAFHVYMHHGVNAAGLSISGATLNEDAATARAAARRVKAWKAAGRHTMPAATGTWMLLSMCADVEEALALIQSSKAPWESTGNMLLLDRSGRAARVESAGMDRQIFRHSGKGKSFFVAGNYPHPRRDGRFQIGERWGQAANSMLRERFLREFAGGRQGRLSLEEVFLLMQSHEAGGMCQHHHDNPGQLETVCSSIAVTRTSDLWLTQGPPCQVQCVRYSLFP